MQLYNYNSKFFTIEKEGLMDEIIPNPIQKKILDELIEAENEFWDSPEYSLHSLIHSLPEYEKGMGGYDYSELIKKWAEDKPQVKSFRFDDCMFMSSVGFIVPSMNKWQHMGVNVILCPQAGEPFDFFCYPSHLSSLLKAFGVAETELLSVPAKDNSSPLFLKKEELRKKLVESV